MDRAMSPSVSSVFRVHGSLRAFVEVARSEDPDWRRLTRLLQQILPAHFDAEERPGGAYEILARHGANPEVLRRLIAAHRTLLGMLALASASAEHGRPDAGEGIRRFADALEAHERIESALAVQCHVATPLGAPERAVGPRGADRALALAMDELACTVVDRVRERGGACLCAVTVALPDDVDEAAALSALDGALADRGLDFVDLSARRSSGPIAIAELRFEEAWAE